MSAARQLSMQVQVASAGEWGAWANDTGRSSTLERARLARMGHGRPDHLTAVRLSELRGAVEAMQSGVHADTLPATRTHPSRISYGSPAAYEGMRFRVGFGG